VAVIQATARAGLSSVLERRPRVWALVRHREPYKATGRAGGGSAARTEGASGPATHHDHPQRPRHEPASHVSLQSTWLQKPGCHLCYKELFRELLCRHNRLRERARINAEKAALESAATNLRFIRRSSPAAAAPIRHRKLRRPMLSGSDRHRSALLAL
jgi:hypothetical protein